MAPGVATKVIAASCALAAFAVALIAGLAADNPAYDILLRALFAMILGQIVGWIVGVIGERTINEAVVTYRQANPVPTDGAMPTRASASASDADQDILEV